MTMSDGTSRASSRARASTAAFSTAWNKPPARRATASAKAATAVIHQPWRPSGRMDQLGPGAAQQAAQHATHEAAGLLCFGRARRGRRSGCVAAAKPEVDVGPEYVDGDSDACVVARKVDADVDARIHARDSGIHRTGAEIDARVNARVDARNSGVDA